MKRKALPLLLGMLPVAVTVAGTTDLSNVPLMNLTGTTSVHPNIMLMLDDSGSMASQFTPDYVTGGDRPGGVHCKARKDSTGGNYPSGSPTYTGGSAVYANCTVGDPPYHSAEFNKQYYNPAIEYQAPYKADGTRAPDMNSANTSGWTAVLTDGIGTNSSQKKDALGNSQTTTNLVTGFPDKVWCNATSRATSDTTNCQRNTADYTYPNASFGDEQDSFNNLRYIYGAPYYFSINVGEYCTDDTLSNCKSTTLGAAAPSGYPVAAKIRWCNAVADVTKVATGATGCQAKKIDNSSGTAGVTKYQLARYSLSVSNSSFSYGTLAIGASASASAGMKINSVTVGGTTVTQAAVTAADGTDTLAKQITVANQVASTIVAKFQAGGGLNGFTACVNTPQAMTPAVPACSTYSITLGADNIVAIVPMSGGTPLNDASKAGLAVVATSNTVTLTAAIPKINPTGLITFSGGTSNTTSAVLNNDLAGSAAISVNGTKAYGSSVTLGKSKSSSAVASTIGGITGINGYTFRAGACSPVNNTTCTPVCNAATSSAVCVIDTNTTSNGKAISMGSISNKGTLNAVISGTTGGQAASAAVTDTIPTVSTATQAGSFTTASPFQRVDIVPLDSVGNPKTFAKSGERADCVTYPGVCTYAEEMTNFSNWYAYYRTRTQTMKSAISLAFNTILPATLPAGRTSYDYRVGMSKLSKSGYGGGIDLYPDDYWTSASDNQRLNFYNLVLGANPSVSTPLQTSLDTLGMMFTDATHANHDGSKGVITSPCQQNFLLFTTDGYWNQTYGGSVPNNDNTASSGSGVSRYCTRANGCLDGMNNSATTLADVALYWYNGGSATGTVSLRPDLEPNMAVKGVVPASEADPNTHLHLSTYTMGLGVSGLVTYDSKYDTTPVVGGDYYKIVTGTTGCPWNAGATYNWPIPSSNAETAVDDLWHAGVNGHGKYYSASDPSEVVAGLKGAIENLKVRQGAASSAATSTPNVTQLDNDIFSATFTTVKWYGELVDKKIDPNTGNVLSATNWSTTDTLGNQAADQPVTATGSSPPSRKFWMLDTSTAGTLKEFTYSAMDSQEQGWFKNKCASLGQCATLLAADQAIVNNGDNMVNYLRGVTTYADDKYFRAYTMSTAATPLPIVLGDIDSAKPAYVGTKPLREYSHPPTRTTAVVYAAANDGMLHAFDTSSGYELWAYAPRVPMAKMYYRADKNYGGNHVFTVDGSPEVADAEIGGAWKTVLIAGLNKGGRGYYALDVTDPATPKALWEFCADPTVCAINDPDIGYTFGNPQVVKWNGTWVALLTSGYNNIPGTEGVATGNGGGYLYVLDLATGSVLKKIGTGVGTAVNPSGLAKITAITANPQTDPVVTYVYAGDLQGNLWRFDFTTGSPSAPLLLASAVGKPITTRPNVALCDAGGNDLKTVVLFGTGRLLGISDITDSSTQSVYVIKDEGTAIGALPNNMVQQTLSVIPEGYAMSSNTVDLQSKNGWYFNLDKNSGERVNLDPLIIFGSAQIVTNVPSESNACSIGGISFNYQVQLCSGAPLPANSNTGLVGTSLSNTAAAVGFIVIRLPGGGIKMIATTAEGEQKTVSLNTLSAQTPRKTGWRTVN